MIAHHVHRAKLDTQVKIAHAYQPQRGEPSPRDVEWYDTRADTTESLVSKDHCYISNACCVEFSSVARDLVDDAVRASDCLMQEVEHQVHVR